MTKAAIILYLILMIVNLSCRNTIDTGFRYQDETRVPANAKSLVDKIQGIWGIIGDETASFVIREDRIIYPEIDAGFRYYLKNDSIKIKYGEGEQVFAVHIENPDTLILTGNERRVYYRYKE